MKSSGDNGKGGEGRGLPRGWVWGELYSFALTDGQGADLFSDADPEDERATAYTTGKWVVWAAGSPDILAEGDAQPSSGETLLAAAQREAEAALWRCDGFGVGEARGVWLSLDAGSEVIAAWMMRRAVALPGLPGMWRVMDGREVEGGVEVDAVRASVLPVSEPAPARSLWSVAAEMQGEPAPSREPPAPTDGELARLLADLPYRIAYARQAARDDEPLDAAIRDLADGAALLLAERATLRARAEEAERRIAELTATPPPHTVAALLARVEAEAVPDRSTWRDYTRGLNKAADIIRATLTPSPLDGVVAEVCALPVEMPTFYASVDSVEDGLHAVDMLIGDHELPRRDRLARIARVALAGMLACDAAPTPCDYCRARDAGRATTARGCTCDDAAKGGA